jgi:hypothetical protein
MAGMRPKHKIHKLNDVGILGSEDLYRDLSLQEGTGFNRGPFLKPLFLPFFVEYPFYRGPTYPNQFLPDFRGAVKVRVSGEDVCPDEGD